MATKKTKKKQEVVEEPKEVVDQQPKEEPKKPEVAAKPVSGGLRRVKVTEEELMKLQKEAKLVGYDPSTQEAIIRQ